MLGLFLLMRFFGSLAVPNAHAILLSEYTDTVSDQQNINANTNISDEMERLNNSLAKYLSQSLYSKCSVIVDSLVQRLGSGSKFDNKQLSDSYYLIGVYYYLIKDFHPALSNLKLSIEIREDIGVYDKRYLNALYNIGLVYYNIGNYSMDEFYLLKSLEIEKQIYGDSTSYILNTYLSLSVAYIELQEYEKAIFYSDIALEIAVGNPENTSPEFLADLYNDIGVCYIRLGDFSKARIYLDKSELLFEKAGLDINDNYINLLNNLAITYNSIGQKEKSGSYYDKGIILALKFNSNLANNLINSYAIFLADNGEVAKGEAMIASAIDRMDARLEANSRNYFRVLSNYAEYLRVYNINIKLSRECYERCMEFLNSNGGDPLLKSNVFTGYALTLAQEGEPEKALGIIQSLLFSDDVNLNKGDLFINPDIESVKPDRRSLRVLQAKYEIILDLYRQTYDLNTLEAAASTSEMIVSLLDKVRINISEEESRLILGDQYRNSYLNSIRDFNQLYTATSEKRYLEKAFEFSEKSKVAGLLASTRELKAAQFHIPEDIADLERKLQRDISLLNEKIALSPTNNALDLSTNASLKENLLIKTRARDSLIRVFEKEYPDYYSIKYNTRVIGINDLSRLTGRSGNYISYILSDSLMYIFVMNRKFKEITEVPVDSVFYKNIKLFRSHFALPSSSENARTSFREYQSSGYYLYKILIESIRKYLISGELLISPDNILSYLSFDALPVSEYTGDRILYRELDYMMNDYSISYTYSATFMAESVKRDNSLRNKVIAFAPDYPEPLNIQTILSNRQPTSGVLADLKYARLEAEYVTAKTGGKLFLNNYAKESIYKSESGKYDIIHLAMHTLLNDRDPMYSTLIFSTDDDPGEDGYLKTFEVYGIPLKAKMVVLSSCNTGLGLMTSGEGILSLARGFAYSGSRSVVMSMWEVEDRSGTEIIESFYDNLKKGNSKSNALRKARKSYLKKADQLRSHPYFWATLVVYGNNAPLYYSTFRVILLCVIVLSIAVILLIYLRKRKYS